MEKVSERVAQLLQCMNERIYGKEQVVALALLSAVAGESVFLLGPPGVAKSMVARRLKLAFAEGTSFEYLMSRFSTPDELFGPVSISKLKERDVYERITEGYLPDATVAFLDEIWKAGPAIQNALLTILNEKTFRNGRDVLQVPLKGLIAASNELPAQGQGLDALWDRFLIRLWVEGIEDAGDFDRMISSTDDSDPTVPCGLAIGSDEYARWREETARVLLDYVVLDVIHSIREQIEDYNHKLQNDDSADEPLYVSDRRWKKAVNMLRTSAFMNGSEAVRLSDCMLLMHCLWSNVTQTDLVRDMVEKAIQKSVGGYLLNTDNIASEIRSLKEELGSDASLRESEDPGLQLIDSYYYQVDKTRMPGRLLLFASDYYALTEAPKMFYLHKDKYKTQCFILKKYDVSMRTKVAQNKLYSLRKGSRSVFINDYEYPLVCVPGCLPLPAIVPSRANDIDERFRQVGAMLDRAESGCDGWAGGEEDYCSRHLFLDARQRKAMLGMLSSHQSGIARWRNELNELKHAYRKENEEYPTEGPEGNLFG